MAENNIRERIKPENDRAEDQSTQTQRPTTSSTIFGPLPAFPHQRVWTRIILVICASVIVYFSSRRDKETIFASHKVKYEQRTYNLPCSESYKFEVSKFKGCIPEKCGRMVSDFIVTEEEADTLLKVAQTGIALGGSEGGASILDLHSGALSHGENFVNFYKLPEATNIFKTDEMVTYMMVKNKIKEAVAQHFRIKSKALHLTHPTFFSRLDNTPPKTKHDEYWHKHVDKETYESFHYTSLVYLNSFKKDFTGGRFVYVNADNSTAVVEPKKGRVSMFTSGAENPHYVEKVSSGVRFAITVSFTCDSSRAISDFKAMPHR